MNYQANLKQSYNIDLDGFAQGVGAYALMDNGSIIDIDDNEFDNFSFDIFTATAVNYARRASDLQAYPVMILAKTPDNLTLLCSTKVDYIQAYGSSGYFTSAYSYGNNHYYDVGDGTPLTNYPINTNEYLDFTQYSYGAYVGNLDDSYSVYDYSVLQGKTINTFKSDSLYLRGENIAYYNTWLSFYGLNSNYDFIISYGSPYADLISNEYDRGYGNGYASGYVDGTDHGYQIGINSHTDQATATAFSYIGGAFNAVAGIMSLEILPHITLGLAFSIPLTLILIMTIFKLVRK